MKHGLLSSTIHRHVSSSVTNREIGREEHLRNDLFCVEWDVNLNSISHRFDTVIEIGRECSRVCLTQLDTEVQPDGPVIKHLGFPDQNFYVLEAILDSF